MTASDSQTLAQGGSRFRRDIEGLRALAVTLVLLYHSGLPVPSGGFAGVDIFFVVSGFVITTQLLRELDRTGRVDLVTFYGRRAKRLLPAAGLVLLVTALAAWLMVSRVQWPSIAGDIRGAALYVVNWIFASRSVDYLAEDIEPSPVLHFWSLAVEEQFYIVWPLVILLLVWVAGRRATRAGTSEPAEPETRRSARLTAAPSRGQLALGMTGLIVVPSLVWAVYYTSQSPEKAFFVTTARLWELGLGALVAIGAARWQGLRPSVGALLAWLGLGTIIAAALVQDTQTPWPGVAALVPTLGTAAVILGGFNAARWGPQVLLGLPGVVWVGALSYSLYLWHWPLLRMAQWQWGELPAAAGVAVVLASVVPAWLSYRFVEHPIRTAPSLNISPRFALSVGVNCTLVALLAGVLLGQAAQAPTGPTAGNGSAVRTTDLDLDGDPRDDGGGDDTGTGDGTEGEPGDGPTGDGPTGGGDEGAAEEPAAPQPPPAEAPGDEPLEEVLTPDPVNATEDSPALYNEGCHSDIDEVELAPCEGGDPDGELVVAVVGDSKIAQWSPVIEAIGEENGWVVRTYTKSGCTFADVLTLADGEIYDNCLEWSRAIFDRLAGPEQPDVLVTSGLHSTAVDAEGRESHELLVEGYLDYWEPLVDRGTTVVAVSDTPQPGPNPVYECVAEHPEDHSEACSWSYRETAGSKTLREAVDATGDGAHYIDMDPWVCPEGTCVGVYRNILTYRQGSHITATYAMLLGEPLAAFLVPIVEGEPSGGSVGD